MGERVSGPAQHPVLIVGAGPAGLAAAACLTQRKVPIRIFEAGDAPGYTWRRLYDRLHLHTVRALSGLPGYPMPRRFPRYPSREQVVEYLDGYARRFGLVIETGMPVQRAAPEGDRWRVETPGARTRGRRWSRPRAFLAIRCRCTIPARSHFRGRSPIPTSIATRRHLWGSACC